MNLGFDFDKIFIDYPPFVPHTLIDRLYKKRADGVLSYRIPSRPEQLIRLLTHHPRFRPPIVENIAFIKNLSKQKEHKYYLISSRFGFLKNITRKLISLHGLDTAFDAMHFNFENNQPHIFKNKVLQKFKIDRYVDDDLPLLKFLASENPKTTLFWLNNKVQSRLENTIFAITRLSEMLHK